MLAWMDLGGTFVGEQFNYQLVALDRPFHVPPLLILILHPLFCNDRCGQGPYCILMCADYGTVLFQLLFHDFHIPLTTNQLLVNI